MADGNNNLTGRREPPRFRVVSLQDARPFGERLLRCTFSGSDLEGFVVNEPAASIRLLVPTGDGLVMPRWNGNEFLFQDGTRPTIRTFTPRMFDPIALNLVVDVLLHEGGTVAEWARTARLGASAAISGPGRGYTIEAHVDGFLLAGDETAIPAISQLVESIPDDVPIRVDIELVPGYAEPSLPAHPQIEVNWHVLPAGAKSGDTLVAAIGSVQIADGVKVWCAGEASAMHRIRTNLFKERGIARADATVRGYWKSR